MSTRREFLFQLGAGALGLVGLQVLPGCEHIDVESKLVGGEVDFITDPADGEWYWQSGNGTAKADAPDIGREEWSLEIVGDGGLSETVDFADLQQLADDGESMTYIKTMRCVFGTKIGALTDSLVSTGIFTGIPLPTLLDRFDLPSDANKVRTFGKDGFESNVPFDRAMTTGTSPLPVMLAYDINGRPMSRLRGGPVRLVAPEMWGYKNMKWLQKLEITADDAFFGTYETEQFAGNEHQDIIDDPGKIALMSTITKPTAVDQEVAGPNITLAGVSFAGGTAIDGVEIALDDGPFEPLEIESRQEIRESLDDDLKPLFDEAEQATGPWPAHSVWVTWSKQFQNVPKGEHDVVIRASDEMGRRQERETGNRLVTVPRIRVPFTVT
jgi:DMSO/TMAO reductase YedYZ molybdopterin-dependent catalytic subunit